MEQIGFLGAYDKKDLLINLATVLTNAGKSVLIVDATSVQRMRYVVPNISTNQSFSYVSEYSKIDVALGFMTLNDIAQYLKRNLNYDYILIDSDNPQTMNSFGIQGMKKIFFVTSYEQYDMLKGAELLRFVQMPIEVVKVISTTNMNDAEDKLLNSKVANPNIKWSNSRIEFSDLDVDRRAILKNQFSKQITFKSFSKDYKQWLEYLVNIIADSTIDTNRIIKRI